MWGSRMKTVLVGGTGFVGSNIRSQFQFDYIFNSHNIQESYGLNPDLLVYAGVRAEMFLANQNPEQDMNIISEAMENIRKISPKKIVLVSTAAVYQNSIEQTEESVISIKDLLPYGRNRYFLECWVRDNFKEHLILRLPALFGKNLKKNFIYDFIYMIPSMLKRDKYLELSEQSTLIKAAYIEQDSGYFTCMVNDKISRDLLKIEFRELGFSALNFTDSRSIYQFYNLEHIWQHITSCLENGIQKLNLATEPIQISELYRNLTGEDFENRISAHPYCYDMRTVYAEQLGGKGHYLYNKSFVMDEIKEFIRKSL